MKSGITMVSFSIIKTLREMLLLVVAEQRSMSDRLSRPGGARAQTMGEIAKWNPLFSSRFSPPLQG